MSRRPFERVLSVEDLKITADRLGNYTFTQTTMSYWNSRVLDEIFVVDDSRGYIVTSEKMEGSARVYNVRKYEIWRHDKTGQDILYVDTVGGFGGFGDARSAKLYAEKRQGFGMLDAGDFERTN